MEGRSRKMRERLRDLSFSASADFVVAVLLAVAVIAALV
jgi:hypothetical protein